MPRVKNPNPEPEHRLSMRLKQHEFAQLQADMAAYNCKSITKYVKAVLFRKRGKPRPLENPSRAIRQTLNQISARIERIGVNYNQAVKRINELSQKKKKNGDPVINSKFLTYYLDNLQAETTKLVETHNILIKQVNLLLPDEGTDMSNT